MTRAALGAATLGPVGLWPWGPGTLASALVALLWWTWAPSWAAWFAVAVAFAASGVAASGRAETVLGHDDDRIVIDEAAGMAVALLAAPRTLAWAGLAFLLFRLLDILKPPPIGRLQEVPGGRGVMIDDLAAGAITAALVGLGVALTGGGFG